MVLSTIDVVRLLVDEVANDGDEGSSLERVNAYIDGIECDEDARRSATLDQSSRSFVVAMLVQHPSIRIGRATAQSSKTKTANEKGKQKAPSTIVFDKVDTGVDVTALKAKYGQDLRLIAETAVINDAIYGSRELNESQRRVIMSITRNRGEGASFSDLCQELGQTTQNIFFHCKALIEFGLIVKLRGDTKKGSSSSHVVAVKYAHLNPLLRAGRTISQAMNTDDVERDRSSYQIKTGELVDDQREDDDPTALKLETMSPEAVRDLVRDDVDVDDNQPHENGRFDETSEDEEDRGGMEELADDAFTEEVGNTANVERSAGLVQLKGLLAFPEIKGRDAIEALSRDKTQLRIRILKLVTESRNMTTISRNLVIRLGPRRLDRLQHRSMRAVIRLMVEEELLQKVPLERSTSEMQKKPLMLIRATEKGVLHYHELRVSEHHKATRKIGRSLAHQLASLDSKIALEVPLERQVLECIAQSQASGMTIEVLNTVLGGSEERKRDLDRMLNAAKKIRAPEYDDIRLSSALEQAGRVRNARFWTQLWRPRSTMTNDDEPALDRSALHRPVKVPFERVASDGSEYGAVREKSVSTRKTKKAKRRKTTSGRGRGRPRKDFSERAIQRREQYRMARGLPLVSEEEGEEDNQDSPASRSSDDENSIETAPTGKRRKTIGIAVVESPAENAPEREQEEGTSPSQAVNGPAERINSSDEPPTSSLRAEDIFAELRQKLDNATTNNQEQAVSQPSINVEQPTPSRTPRTNLTMHLKSETLLAFIRSVGVIESSKIERLYGRYVREKFGVEDKKSAYDMDRRVRLRLLAGLVKANQIGTKKTMGPKSKAGRPVMATLYYASDAALSQVSEYARKLFNGELNDRGAPNRSWMEQQPVAMGDVDLPIGPTFSNRTLLFALATSFDDLLDDPQLRQDFVNMEQIRSYYTGRYVGRAARMQFTHEVLWNLLRRPSNDDLPFIRVETSIVNLTWWLNEAKLSQYLRLALPPNDENVFSASQDASICALPMKSLDVQLKSKLDLHPTLKGLRETFEPIMQDLAALGLVKRVSSTIEIRESSNEGMLYQLEPHARLLGWNSRDELVQSQESISFDSEAQTREFWSNLLRARKNDGSASKIAPQSWIAADFDAALVDFLVQNASWYNTYRLTKYQSNFVMHAIELGKLDKSVIENAELMKRISHAALIPTHIVEKFFRRRFHIPKPNKLVSRSGPTTNTASYVRNKGYRSTRQRQANALPMTKRRFKRIQRQAKRAKAELEAVFDAKVSEFFLQNDVPRDICDILSAGLQRARDAYGKQSASIRADQLEAIFDSFRRLFETGRVDSYNSFVRQTTAPRSRGFSRRKSKPIQVTEQQSEQGDEQDERSGGRKRAPRKRKQAVEWTPERDEILRDCGVILRAREKHRNIGVSSRKNWSAMRQVFPLATGTVLHARFLKLQSAVGEEAYLAQLEVEWTKLWTKCRGTAALRDGDPRSLTEFDLNEHLAFLRAHINKRDVLETLRTGTGEPLPLNIERFAEAYDLEFPPESTLIVDPTALLTDRHGAGDLFHPMRGELLARTALSKGMLGGSTYSSHPTLTGRSHDDRLIAQDIFKMILGTEEDQYDVYAAKVFGEKNTNDANVDRARRALENMHIAKRKAKEGRAMPGRKYEFTDDWQSFMSDANLAILPPWQSISPFVRAIETAKRDGQLDQTVTVFQNITDADAAVAIQLIESGLGDVRLATDSIAEFAQNRLFNAKKLTDADLEIPVDVEYSADQVVNQSSFKVLHDRLETLLEGGYIEEEVMEWLSCAAAEGNVNERRKTTIERWNEAYERLFTAEAIGSNVKTAIRVRVALDEAGPHGLTRQALTMLCNETCSLDDVIDVIDVMQSATPPLAFLAGRDQARLVSSVYVFDWTIGVAAKRTNKDTDKRVFPHLWFDIYGDCNKRIWHDSMALVLYAVYTYPGVTLARIVDHMRVGGLSRLDVNHLVACACRIGLVRQFLSSSPIVEGNRARWLANSDEDLALSFVDDDDTQE